MTFLSSVTGRKTFKPLALSSAGVAELFFVFAMGFVLGVIPELIHAGFYFLDDMQHQYMPAFYHIGRTLRAGEFPILTLAQWQGGNYFAEYQYALLNPVSLALYALLPSFDSFNAASAFLASFYTGVLASGFYYLARTYGVTRLLAWLAAFFVATDNFIAYWFASSWFPGLVSMAWAVWAWAFLIKSDRSAKHWCGAVVFSYLTLSAGWPFTVLFWGLVVALLAAQRGLEKKYWSVWFLILAATGALFLALPAFMALVSIGPVTTRLGGIFNNGTCVPSLQDTLALSFPFHRGFLNCGIEGLYRQSAVPFYACAWFIFPLLTLVKWEKVEWKRPSVLFLTVLSGLLLFATMGPDQVVYLRLPYRFIPYFHLPLLLLIALFISRAGLRPFSRQAVLASFGLILLSALMAWQRNPSDKSALPLALVYGLAWAVFLKAWQQNARQGILALGGAGFLFFILTRAVFPANYDNVNWTMSPARQDNALVNEAPGAYTFYLGSVGARGKRNTLDPERLKEYQTGNMTLEYGVPSIGGYTPIGHAFLEIVLCQSIFGATCPNAAYHLFGASDPETGASTADLFRIDRVVAMKGPHLDTLGKYLPGEWRLESDGLYTQRFARDLPNARLPGTVSWTTPNVTLEATGKTGTLKESFRVEQRHGSPNKIVFARLWWPGYKAVFAGEEAPVRATHGIFVTVDLPLRPEKGELVLSYLPARLTASLLSFAFGTALCLFVVLFYRRFAANKAGKPSS